MLDESMTDFGAFLHGAVVMNSQYLRENRVFQKQYFVLNRGATEGRAALTERQAAQASKLGGPLIGAYEAIRRFPGTDAWSLEAEAHGKGTTRLGNGTYVSKHALGREDYCVVNAFHPAQIESLTSGGICVAFACHTERPYRDIAEELVGHFNPQCAGSLTLRGKLFENNLYLGMPRVSTLLNGFHVSPGALEAMRAIATYFGIDPTNYCISILGARLAERGYSPQRVEFLLDNPLLQGGQAHLFDRCEGQGMLETLELLEGIEH